MQHDIQKENPMTTAKATPSEEPVDLKAANTNGIQYVLFTIMNKTLILKFADARSVVSSISQAK